MLYRGTKCKRMHIFTHSTGCLANHYHRESNGNSSSANFWWRWFTSI